MNNKKTILIIFIAIIFLVSFGFAKEALATYNSSGTLISNNLLSGLTVNSIDSFYTSSTVIMATSLWMQFSTNTTAWYSAGGTLDGTTTVPNGQATTSLSALGWSGPNFYYKMQFTSSDGSNTPVLDEIKVNYNYTFNNSPTITSVSDNSPKCGNEVITFTSVASDPDAGNNIKLYICDSADCTNCVAGGVTTGCWAVGAGATATGNPQTLTATKTCGTCDYSTNNYWAKVCDNYGACSSIITSLAGWLSGYGYRKQITINGSTAGAQTNYQMKLTVHKETFGTDFLSGGTATADSQWDVNYAASYAFDNNEATRWSSTNSAFPHWVKYDLGTAITKTARKLRLKSFGSGVNCQLKDFKLQGSNNDADWTDILTAVGSNTDAWQEWAFANSVAYRYYRIYVTSSYYTGGNQVSIWEIELMESTSPPADYGSDVYLNNHCQDDFDDIRFTKSNGDTLLDYWLESKVNGTSAIFWIEFDSIPASPSTVNFYIYYDNPSASSASNEKSTFGIENRNFDIPPAGNSWTCVKSGVGACTAVDTDYHSSPYNAYSYETSRACMRARLGQNITVPDMASVYLHYWIKWWVNTWGNHVGIVIGATTTDASSGTWLEAHSGNGSGSSSGWVERWVDISAWKGQTVKLEVVDQDDTDDDPTYCSYGDHGGWVRADDFYISSAGSAVSPEPTWGTWGGEEKGQASPFACKKADNICSCGSPSCPTDGFCEECCGGCCCSGSCHTCPCPVVGVCNPHNVWGWAWSENIGWISFSCENTMTVGVEGPDYGVDIDRATGLFSGYAWSENIGWIRFNPPPDPTYSNNYPAIPYYSARVSTTTGEVSGWARACAGTANPDICATGTNPAAGSWDGWIKLRGPNYYGVWIDTSVSPAEFRNWAWSDMVVGWLRFAGPVINANGLAASWAMDEGNEGYIYDSSGNNSTGTISGATWTTSGKYGSALSFDGNDYVNLGSPASLALANTTIEAWIKPSSVAGYYLIYGLSNLPKLYIDLNGRLVLYDATAANTVLTPNVWTHVVATSDGTNVRYYINGVPDGTVAHVSWSATPSQVKIGRDPAGTTQNFLGLIDEVRIYNRALSAAEIQKHYAEGLEKHKNLAIK